MERKDKESKGDPGFARRRGEKANAPPRGRVKRKRMLRNGVARRGGSVEGSGRSGVSFDYAPLPTFTRAERASRKGAESDSLHGLAARRHTDANEAEMLERESLLESPLARSRS